MQRVFEYSRPSRDKQPLCRSWLASRGCAGYGNQTCPLYHKREYQEANMCPLLLQAQDCDGISCPWHHDNTWAARIKAQRAEPLDPVLDAVRDILAFNTTEEARSTALDELRYLCPEWLYNMYPSLKPLGMAIKTILDSSKHDNSEECADTQHPSDPAYGSN